MTTEADTSRAATTIRVAAAQINTTVGDIDGNVRLVQEWTEKAQAQGVELLIFPELTITGYPPEDLVLYDHFIEANKMALQQLAASISDVIAVVGFVDSDEEGNLYNAAAVLHQGAVVTVYRKVHLPNYGVFDEQRYFKSGDQCPVLVIRGIRVGVNICEDIWEDVGPSEVQCVAGAQIVVNLNSSPYESGKQGVRVNIVTSLARRNRAFTLYANQVGGQDELVFDGGSMLAGPDGKLVGTAPRFEETLLIADLNVTAVDDIREKHPVYAVPEADLAQVGIAYEINISSTPSSYQPQLPELSVYKLDRLEAIYRALVLGTRDYVRKTGFKKVAVAVSGGIDSAIVTAIAVDAIGAENVIGVALPSRYSSEGSVSDTTELCARLGVDLWNIPIEPGHRAFEEMLDEAFEETEPGLAEENMQSRIRGNIMMSIANKFNWLVLTTGNKSEMATGYGTLYGDMAGAYAVIKDVPKTVVYELCEHRNRCGPGAPIPQAIIDKPPSAELRPDQLDQDSLPPYDQLDRIIHMYIEGRLSLRKIIESEAEHGENGANESVIRRVIRLVDINEYKRRQTPPGVKITGLAFGRDRRLPIASGWQK